MPATRSGLNATPCAVPGCTECAHKLYLRAQCHPQAPLNVEYDKELGWLVIHCHKCKMLVVEVEIGRAHV